MDNQINVANPLATPSPVGSPPMDAAPSPNPFSSGAASPMVAASDNSGNPAGVPSPEFPSNPMAPVSRPPSGQISPSTPPAPPERNRTFGEKLLAAVGGVLTGLGKVESNLGDAADPNGTGPLSGIEQTMARQNAKIEEQKRYDAAQKEKQLERQDKLTQEQRIQKREDDEAASRIGTANVMNHHTTQSDYIMGDEYMDKKILQDKHDLESISGEEGAEGLTQVFQRGVTGDQMHALMQEGKVNPFEYKAFKTGKKVTGEVDANGNPKADFTYDLVKVPKDWTPTKNQIARIKTVPGYEDFKEGTHLTGAQTLAALQQSDQIRTTNDMVNAARAKHDMDSLTSKQESDLAAFNKTGDWGRFLNTYSRGGEINMIGAAAHMLQDKAMQDKYGPSLVHSVMQQFANKTDPTGVENYDKMVHERALEATERIKAANAGLGMLPSGGAMTNEMKANIGGLSPDKQAIISKYDSPTQASLFSIAYGPGDLSLDTFPNRVSAKSGQLDRNHAVGILRQLNPNWNEGQYKQTQAAYKQVTFGRNGQDVETYNNLLDHMSNAQDIIEDSLRSKNPKFLNSAINIAQREGWGTEATKIQTALEPVKTEFESLMNAGHALHADQQKLYDQMINPASTPAQLEAAFKNFGATGVVRLLGLNDQYKKIAGKNLPGVLRSEALDAAKHLNLDPKTMQLLGTLDSGDTLFHNAKWTPGTPQEQQQFSATAQQQQQAAATATSPEHVVFNSQAWAQAHPGADVNAAIAQAKKKGYEVK